MKYQPDPSKLRSTATNRSCHSRLRLLLQKFLQRNRPLVMDFQSVRSYLAWSRNVLTVSLFRVDLVSSIVME